MEMVLDDVALSELQKATILKDTSGVAHQSFKAYDAPTYDILANLSLNNPMLVRF